MLYFNLGDSPGVIDLRRLASAEIIIVLLRSIAVSLSGMKERRRRRRRRDVSMTSESEDVSVEWVEAVSVGDGVECDSSAEEFRVNLRSDIWRECRCAFVEESECKVHILIPSAVLSVIIRSGVYEKFFVLRRREVFRRHAR